MEGDRFRSFLERYVIARAPSFVKGEEREEAWKAVLDARSIYEQIALQGKIADQREHYDNGMPNIQAGVAGATTGRIYGGGGGVAGRVIGGGGGPSSYTPSPYTKPPAPPPPLDVHDESSWTGRLIGVGKLLGRRP